MYQPKESVPHPKRGRMNGVVHHALAFNTLLSSQETDAFPVTRTRLGARQPGRSILFCCVLILSGRPGLSETGAFGALCTHPVELVRISTTLFPGQPLQLTPTSASCQLCRHVRFARVEREEMPGGSPTRGFKAPEHLAQQDEHYQDSHVTETTCQPSPSLARLKHS
jgi:hypothetical protein